MKKDINVFDEIDKIKEKVEELILNDQEILKLVSVPSDNPLIEADISKPSKLKDQYIYFRPRAISTIKEEQSFLLTDYRIVPGNAKNFVNIELIFRVLVHNNLFELHDGKMRHSQIAGRLLDLFGRTRGSWIGECEFKNSYSIDVPTDYQAIQLIFRMSSFK